MGIALEEAQLAWEAGEVPVGSIVLNKGGEIVGRGQNACIKNHDVSAHAEIMALRMAGKTLGNYRLNDCVLVVTLEPCAMCAAAIVMARLAGVVYGCVDQQAGAVVSRSEYLDVPFCQGAPVWHLGGIRAFECCYMLQQFFAEKRS
ncbi:MAG: nucleoside deaminase [Desulfovibrionaceae bacterium]|nr:nucleoside deaminase [Desulfovibrionaceae bacterium]